MEGALTRIDVNRIAAAAIEAAFEHEKPRRRRLTGFRAVAREPFSPSGHGQR
jgi:hypothetical protein